ncbi:unnamed protein product [marine sediment metagenome]|uniref:Uncharacterized protein n=1 Tax=marine sediment metagenome TaxID=412755 RepID=X1NGF8_9ZZZZ
MGKIENSGFGSIVINGKRYCHDVWVFTDGSVEKRRGGNHTFLAEEIQNLLKGNPEIIIVGAGTSSCVGIGKEAGQLAENKNIKIERAATPKAIETYNQLVSEGMKVAAAFHVTC